MISDIDIDTRQMQITVMILWLRDKDVGLFTRTSAFRKSNNHGDFSVCSICWHRCTCICCHLSSLEATSKGTKVREAHQFRNSCPTSVCAVRCDGECKSSVLKVGNFPSYDKDPVRKWIWFNVFHKRENAMDRAQWTRSCWLKFLHSVSKQRIPSGYWFSFERQRESHSSQCTNHVGGKHLLVGVKFLHWSFSWLLCCGFCDSCCKDFSAWLSHNTRDRGSKHDPFRGPGPWENFSLVCKTQNEPAFKPTRAWHSANFYSNHNLRIIIKLILVEHSTCFDFYYWYWAMSSKKTECVMHMCTVLHG